MAKLTFLGTGGGLPSVERETMTMLLEEDDDKILIECCPSILRQLARIHFNPTDITSVFLSHTRSGHFLGFPAFLFGNKALDRQTKLLVLTPEGSKDFLRTILENICPWTARIRELEIQELSTTRIVDTTVSKNCAVKTAPMEHIVPVLGCRIRFTGSRKVIAYSSDTKPCRSLPILAKKADVLIHDCSFEHAALDLASEKGHSTAKQAGQTAANADVGTLVLGHPHSSRYSTSNFEKTAVREAKEAFKGRVLFAQDFQTIEF